MKGLKPTYKIAGMHRCSHDEPKRPAPKEPTAYDEVLKAVEPKKKKNG